MAVTTVGLLIGCSGAKSGNSSYPKSREELASERVGKLTGEGIVLFGGKKRGSGATEGINVNSYLWRATLDTVYFMPLLNADPFGGTVLTDWYQENPKAKERFKFNILITGTELRANAIKVSAFKQVLDASGKWQNASISAEFAADIEERIINRAREIRVGNL